MATKFTMNSVKSIKKIDPETVKDRKEWLAGSPKEDGVLEIIVNGNKEISGARMKGVPEEDIREAFRKLPRISVMSNGSFRAKLAGATYTFGFRYKTEDERNKYYESRGGTKIPEAILKDLLKHNDVFSKETQSFLATQLANSNKIEIPKEIKDDPAKSAAYKALLKIGMPADVALKTVLSK